MLPEGPRREHAVLIENGCFADVGPLALLQGRYPDHQVLRLDDQLLMPGFIDTHHHLSQSFGKGLVFGEPSEIFKRIWIPLEGSLDTDLLYLTSKLAAFESLRGGFTTVCDAGTRSREGVETIARAVHEVGIRCVLAKTCNDLQGGQVLEAGAILARAEQHLSEWDNDTLVGGLYGLAMGPLFFGESMFSRADNASKVGFATLVSHLKAWGFVLIDCQMPTNHLESLGARSIPRQQFADYLHKHLDLPTNAEWV